MSDWRGALGRIASGTSAEADAGGARRATVPAPRTRLAVQFEVRESVRRGGGRWEHVSKSTTAASERSIGQLSVTVRPAMLGASGKWIGGNLSWPNLQHQVHQLGLDPRQVRWFSEFAALARAGGTFLGQDSMRISLDLFSSSLLWHLFSEARALGIELVGNGKKGAAVRVGRSAGIRLDASADRSGDIRLRPLAQIDGRDVTDAQLGAIGDHGLYAISWPGPVVRLAPSEAPIGAQQLKLLASRGLEVPAEEREEFFQEFYPTIAAALPIVSTDATVAVPETPADRRPTGADGAEGGQAPDEEELDEDIDFAPQDELSDAPSLTLTLVPSDQNDWLNLGFVVHVGGWEVPFAKLFAAISKGQKKLKMVDKNWLALDQPVFERLRELIEEAGGLDEWEAGVRITRQQVSLWEDFEDLADEADAAVQWREHVRALLGSAPAAEAPLPAGLAAELRPYQLEGFHWLARLYGHGLGGVLADDMGLGKTVQALALVQHAVEAGASGPFLVVAPSTVVGNWLAEAARFTPGLRVASVDTTQRKAARSLAELASGADIVVTSYAIFRLDFDDFEDVSWAGLLLDEAQFVKNRRSRAHECARALPAPFKLAITGTPMENDLTELWAMFDIVAPGLFPSVRRFTEQYVRPMSHVTAPESLPAGISRSDADRIIAQLRRRIRPLMLRRSKEQVAPELPPKQEQVLRVELSPRHRRLYEQYLQRERQKLLGLTEEELDRQRFIIFRSITLLRMLALDAALIDEEHRGVPSSKLDALLEQLEDVLAEGHRALVFSQFTSFLHRVEERLNAAGIAYEYLDGSTSDRTAVVRGFKQGDAPVFLISLKAGGFGINLTEADYVFLLDPWWNPSAEAQAIDRAHRIGQDKNVMVYRLVAEGTIEDKVMALRDRKAQLFDAVMDEEGFAGALSADDIRGLLEL